MLAFIALRAAPPRAQAGTGPAYLPAQFAPPPTPTPGPPPLFVTNLPLPTAECPNSVANDRVADYLYVVNNYSNNVSVFQDRQFRPTSPRVNGQRSIAIDPNSTRAWVTNLHSGVSVLDGGVQVGFVPEDYEPYGARVQSRQRLCLRY